MVHNNYDEEDVFICLLVSATLPVYLFSITILLHYFALWKLILVFT